MVRSNIMIVFRASFGVRSWKLLLKCAHKEGMLYTFFVACLFFSSKSTKKESSVGRKSLLPTRETMARFFPFVSRSMNIIEKDGAIILSPGSIIYVLSR